MVDLLKDELIGIRVEAGIFFALDELKGLLDKNVSQICRDLMAEAIQARLLNDSERPLAPALVKRYPGLGIFKLYRDFVSAKQVLSGFQFVESIKINDVTRYIIASPSHVVAKGANYWESIRETLMGMGIPESEIPKAIELWKQKMQPDKKTAQFVEAKNKARLDALRAAEPDKAAAADKVIREAEEAEKAEG